MKTNHKQTYNYASTFTPLLRHVTPRILAVAMFVAVALLGTTRGSETETMAPATGTEKAGQLSQGSLVVYSATDPFDDGDVEVAGQHHRLVAEVLLGVLRADRRLDGAKAELLFQLTLDGDLRHRFRERDLHVQPRVGGADVAAEPEHDADGLGLDLIERARENDENQ